MQNTNTAQFDVIGTDTTALQSAWSAVVPAYYDHVVENRAVDAFVECTQRYVYYRHLLAPIPGKEPGITNPLMELWFDSKSVGKHPDHSPLVKGAGAIGLTSIRASVQSGNFDLGRDATQDQVKILEIAGKYAHFSANAPFYTKLGSISQDLVT